MILYNHFSLIHSRSTKNISTKILSKTKDLTLSREKYNSFIESSLISSGKKIIHHLPKINLMRHSESQKSFEQKKENIMDNLIFPYRNKNPFTNKNLKNKKIQPFFLSELKDDNDDKDKEKIKINQFPRKNMVRLKKILKFPRTDKNLYKNKINLSKIKTRNKEKQIYILMNSIFSEEKRIFEEDDKNIKEEQIKYEEEKIFGFRDKYLSYLRNELSLIHKGEKELEKKYNISYEYKNRIYGKIKLELKSANILITNKENEETCCSIDIPFSMMCLFYLSHFKELTYIVLGLFSNENFLENDQNNLLSELKDIIMNQITYENDVVKYINNINEEDRKTIFDEYLNKRNLKNRSNIKYNFLSLYSKREAFKQIIFENCTYSINNIIANNDDDNDNNNNNNSKISDNSYHSQSSETLKILFDTNINVINFSWISLKNNYNIKISMPKIVIYFPKFQREINHFINKELLIYLMINNFSNFNFFAVHYLFTLKKFRAGINKVLSYYDLYNIYPFYSNIINNDNDNYNTNLIYQKYHISNIHFEEYENSLNDNEYNFYVSDDDKFHLYKMKSYTLFIYSMESLDDLKNPKIFFFNFSFNHMKVLFYKSKYDNLLQFLQRLLKYNPATKNITLDYKFFSSFKYMNCSQIDRYFKESSFKVEENTKNIDNEIIQNDLVLRVLEPKFISVSVDKKNNNEKNEEKKLEGEKKVGNVGRKLIEKLIQNDIKDWGKILWENKDDIEPLKKKIKKKNIFEGKKDFKAIFKKFLKIDG